MLEDIESLENIPDYSLYITIVFFSLIFVMLFFIFKAYQKRKNTPPSKEELALKHYKDIDFSNPKKAAYLITKYGFILAKDKKSKEIYKELLQHLSKYKYKKNVEAFDDKTVGLYNLFLEVASHE